MHVPATLLTACALLHLRILAQPSSHAVVGVFSASSAFGICTKSRVNSVKAAGILECFFLCAHDAACWSFSYIAGFCGLSASPSCAGGAAELFVKTAPPQGYIEQLGGRRLWVFQQRRTGSVSFARNWTDYERGFGDKDDFWAGLSQLHSATVDAKATLRIELAVLNGSRYVAEWSNFIVGDAASQYVMRYDEYLTGSSNFTSDPLSDVRGVPFSTLDRTNNLKSAGSCSAGRGNSGFWFLSCTSISPNGIFDASFGSEFLGLNFMYSRYTCSGFSLCGVRWIRMMLEMLETRY